MSAALTTPFSWRSIRIVLELSLKVFHDQTLDVEDDVGYILDDAGNRGDFVLDALDFDLGDGTAFQAGKQHAPKTVAYGACRNRLQTARR